MRARWECMSCFIDDFISAGQLILPEHQQFEVFAKGLDLLADRFNQDRTPSYFITALHRLLKDASGDPRPFSQKREQCNQVVMEITERWEPQLAGLSPPERFRRCATWAVSGNSLDFRTVGAGYTFDVGTVEASLLQNLEKGLHCDDSVRLWETLRDIGEVLYIPDNVGELALDQLLMREIKRTGASLTVSVPAGSITSDVTSDDLQQVGVDLVADSLISSGPDTLGISLEEMSDDLKEALRRSKLIVAKGQANFYALSEIKDRVPGMVVCLFTTKCDLVSGLFGRTGKLNILKIL